MMGKPWSPFLAFLFVPPKVLGPHPLENLAWNISETFRWPQPECTKIARFSAVAAAIFTAPPQNRAISKAPRCAISSAKKIASERRFSLRLKGTNLTPTAEFPAIPESAAKIASERRCAILVHSDPNPQYFSKSTAVQMGGVLPYKWEAYCSTNERRIAGFPFLRSLEARKVLPYKWGAYCRTNWRCTAVLSPRPVGDGVSETLPNIQGQRPREILKMFNVWALRVWGDFGTSFTYENSR